MANTTVPAELINPIVPLGRRNLVINGAMTVAQRGTSATAMTSGGVFLIDRFKCIESSNGAATVEQSTDTPADFAKSLKLDVTTADTDMGGGQYSQIKYVVEAQDLQRLNYGTSDAETITLSFWVKSSKTGTYCISIVKHDSTAYFYVKEYTISSANTWEKKTITITPTAGSTTLITNSAGAIADDSGDGLQLGWFLSAGTTYNGATDNAWSSNSNHYATSNQVNWMDSTSNNFYLTGVQLEVGDQATPFEHLTFDEQDSLCKRYYQQYSGFHAMAMWTYGRSNGSMQFVLEKEMRAKPTFSYSGTLGSLQTDSHCGIYESDWVTISSITAGSASSAYNSRMVRLDSSHPSNTFASANVAVGFYAGSSFFLIFDAEL